MVEQAGQGAREAVQDEAYEYDVDFGAEVRVAGLRVWGQQRWSKRGRARARQCRIRPMSMVSLTRRLWKHEWSKRGRVRVCIAHCARC